MSDKTGTYEHFIKPAKPQPQYPRELNHVLVDSLDKLTQIFSENEGKYIAWDTETSSLDPTVGTIVGFSFAYDDKTGYYVPLRHKPGGNIEDPEKALDLFYNHLLKAKVSFLYNARFDLRFMEYQGYDMGCLKFYDVYIGAWLADTNNKTMSLKANEKHFLGWDPDTFTETIGDSYDFSYLNVKDCYIYASADAIGTFALCMKTIGYYKESKLSGKLSNQFLYPLMKYEDNGTLIDIDYLSNMLIEQNDRLKELENKIYKEVGYPFKINSNKQLGDALQSMGVNTGVYTKGGQMKVDIPTLSHYNFKNPTPIIDTLIEYSKLFKMINSYTSTLLDEANRQGGRCRFGYITGRVPCLTEDAKVLIKNRGLIPIKYVQKGDKIHTQYGYYEVLDTSNHKSDTIYKVTLSDGTILKGSTNHPILISRSINPRPNTVGNMWSTLSALSVGDIAIMNSRMPKSLETPRLTAFSYNGKFLSMSKSFMRLLGYLINPRNYTDGDTIKIKMYRDYKFSIYVNLLNNVFPKKPFIIQDKSIIIKDVEVIKILRYFMELMKTRVPHLILSSSPSYLKYFLTGVYDGCAIFRSSNVTSPQKPTLVFHNKEVAETIFEIHKAIGLNVTLYFNGNYNIHYKTMKGNYKFFNIIGKFLANPRYIETNINSYYEISENRATVESIEILPADTVYHIEVDQVHEYIANGIITHNTGRLAGSGDKKNTYFSNINIQSIPKAPSMNWYVHEYHEGDELKPYDEVVCGYRFSLEDKSKYVIEGRTPKENIRKALLPEKNGYWVSMDYSGQELRAIANITGEKRWVNTFLSGGDLHRCYSDDTEFLTDKGYKLYDDIVEGDKIAQYIDGRIEYVDFISRYEGYSDTMINLKSNSSLIDLWVTPNHRTLFRTSSRNKYKVWEAERLVGRSCINLPIKFEYPGVEREAPFVFDAVVERGRTYSKTVSFDADTFIEFLGFYLGDGHAGTYPCKGGNSYRINLAQSLKPNKAGQWIKELNKRMGNFFRENLSTPGFLILEASNRNIVRFIEREFLSTGTKRIPEWVYNLSLRQRELFLQAFIKADGCVVDGKEYNMLYSNNQDLLNDLMRLANINGYRTHQYPRHDSKHKSILKGKEIEVGYIPYCGIVKRETVNVKATKVQKRMRVVCFEVPSSFLVVRRGIACISGNSMAQGMWGEENYDKDKRKRAKVLNFGMAWKHALLISNN